MSIPPADHSHRSRSLRGREWLFRAIACGVPLLLGGLIIWFGIQKWRERPIYLQEKGHEKSGHRYLFDPQLGWRNIPGWKATTFGKPLTINSHGLRDREYTIDKPADKKRLLILGDSYAWGYGVGNEETFSEVLEGRLQGWEVLNTAVSGWGTDQQLLYFESEGVKYSPDIVVVAFFLGNDPENNGAAMQYGFQKPVFLNADLNLANSPVPRPGERLRVIPRKSRDEQLEITIAILGRLNDVCRRHGAKLVVMKFGAFLYEGKQAFSRFERNFENRFSRQLSDIPYLDLDTSLADRGVSNEEILHGNHDGHWNLTGHRLAAEVLQDFLSRQSWWQ